MDKNEKVEGEKKERTIIGEAILVAQEKKPVRWLKSFMGGTVTIDADERDTQLHYGDIVMINENEFQRLKHNKLITEGRLVEVNEDGTRVSSSDDNFDIRTDEELEEIVKYNFKKLQSILEIMNSPTTLNRLVRIAETQDVTVNVLGAINSRFEEVCEMREPFDRIIPSTEKRRIDVEQEGKANIPPEYEKRPTHMDDVYIRETEATPIE